MESNNFDKASFEFQMLYGIRRDLQEKLVKEGYRMRVYIPFGPEWYPLLHAPVSRAAGQRHLHRQAVLQELAPWSAITPSKGAYKA